jgi:molybdopterin/thiamine biosynthesis adenylyltransferase
MKLSIASSPNPFPTHLEESREVQIFTAEEIRATHPAEADLFARHAEIPGHNQTALANARIFMVGAGGLNSWAALALARSGAQSITIADPDLVERTNLSRQLFFAKDLGKYKGPSLAENLVIHAVGGATITGIPFTFEQAIQQLTVPADVLVVGVDNNSCRLGCVREARSRQIPAIFTMLSLDGMRCQSFLQGPSQSDACLWCALPNLDPENALPCAAAIASTCMMAASLTVNFVHRALMGWPKGVETFNWRETDVLDRTPNSTGQVNQRAHESTSEKSLAAGQVLA